jgi:hypothetical protein
VLKKTQRPDCGLLALRYDAVAGAMVRSDETKKWSETTASRGNGVWKHPVTTSHGLTIAGGEVYTSAGLTISGAVTCTVPGAGVLPAPVVLYSDAVAKAYNFDTTATNAFVDGANAAALGNYPGEVVEFFDGTNYALARIGAKGTGETLDTELLSTPGCDKITLTYGTLVGAFGIGDVVTDVVSGATGTIATDNGSVMTLTGVAGAFGAGNAIAGAPSLATAITTSYVMTGIRTGAVTYSSTSASIAGGQSGNCLEITRTGGYSRAQTVQAGLTVGALYAYSAYVKSGTMGAVASGLYLTQDDNNVELFPNSGISFTSSAVWTKHERIFTTPATSLDWWLGGTDSGVNGQTILFDTVSLRQLLTPSSTGVTLTAMDGTTRSFASKHAAWNPNATQTVRVLRADSVGGTILRKITPIGWHGADGVLHPFLDATISQRIIIFKSAMNVLTAQIEDITGVTKTMGLAVTALTMPDATEAKIAIRWGTGGVKIRLGVTDGAVAGGLGSGILTTTPTVVNIGTDSTPANWETASDAAVLTFSRALSNDELTAEMAKL